MIEQDGPVTTVTCDRVAATHAVGRATDPVGRARPSTPRRWTALRQVITTLVVTGVLGGGLVSCVVQRMTGPRITGTCEGACAHYAQCKPGHSDADRSRCTTECPDVFGDRDSLMAYESLSCDDAVEFVDGSNARTAAHR